MKIFKKRSLICMILAVAMLLPSFNFVFAANNSVRTVNAPQDLKDTVKYLESLPEIEYNELAEPDPGSAPNFYERNKFRQPEKNIYLFGADVEVESGAEIPAVDNDNEPKTWWIGDNNNPTRVSATVNGDPRTSIGFNWYTSKAADSYALVSKSSDMKDATKYEAVPQPVTSRFFKRNNDGTLFVDNEGYYNYDDREEYIYKAKATNLEPNTTYYYQVGSDANGMSLSSVGTFKTAGNEGEDFSFIHITDTQNAYYNQFDMDEAWYGASTLEEALKLYPDLDFIVHTGDIVEYSESEDEWVDILEQSKKSITSKLFVPASGNHDELGLNRRYTRTQDFNRHFNVPITNGISGGSYYSYDYNGVHFIVANTNDYKTDGKMIGPEQREWIKQDVEKARANGAEWVIMSYHKPLYSKSYHSLSDRDILAVKQEMMQFIDEYDIDLCMQGHDHVLARTKSLKFTQEHPNVYAEIADNGVNGDNKLYRDTEGTVFVLPNMAGTKAYDDFYSKGLEHTKRMRSNLSWMTQEDLDHYNSLFALGGQPAIPKEYKEGYSNNRDSTIQNFAHYEFKDGDLHVKMYQVEGEKGSERTTKVIDEFTLSKSKYEVEFKVDETKATIADEESKITGIKKGTEASTLKTPSVKTKPGYVFKGWKPEITGPINENKVYTAQFEAKKESQTGVVADWIFNRANSEGNIADGTLKIKDATGNGNDLKMQLYKDRQPTTDVNAADWTKYLKFDNKGALGNESLDFAGDNWNFEAGADFITVDDAPINSEEFRNGYTIELLYYFPEDWTANDRWMGVLARQVKDPANVNTMDEPEMGSTSLAISNVKEFQFLTVNADDSHEMGSSAWGLAMDKGGEWYHLAVVADNNGIKTYVNGGASFRDYTADKMIGMFADPEDGRFRVGSSYWLENGQTLDKFLNGNIERIRITGEPLDRKDWLINPEELADDFGHNDEINKISDNGYNFVFIPDTQNTVKFKQDVMEAGIDGLLKDIDKLDIKGIFHLGDVVEDYDSTEQFETSKRIFNKIPATGVSNLVVPGNHDYLYDKDNNSVYDLYYKEYFGDGSDYAKLQGDKVKFSPSGRSSYTVIDAGSYEYLVMGLSWYDIYANKELQWAQQVLDAHKNLPTILVSHNILNNSDTEPNSVMLSRGGRQNNVGADLWNNLIKSNSQIFMTYSGHHHGAGYTIEKNNAGQDVLMVLADYQFGYNGGNAFFKYAEFDEDNNKIYIRTYSPYAASLKPEEKGYFDVNFMNGRPGNDDEIDFNFKDRFKNLESHARKFDVRFIADETKATLSGNTLIKDVTEGTDLTTLEKPSVITKPGYRFTGWVPEPTGTVNKNITFVAQFSEVSPVEEKINYNADLEYDRELGREVLKLNISNLKSGNSLRVSEMVNGKFGPSRLIPEGMSKFVVSNLAERVKVEVVDNNGNVIADEVFEVRKLKEEATIRPVNPRPVDPRSSRPSYNDDDNYYNPKFIGFFGYGDTTTSPLNPVTPSTITKPVITDIAGHWGENPFNTVVNKGYMDLENGKFYPNRDATRLEFVRAMARMAGANPNDYMNKKVFDDVVAGTKDAGYINWAYEKGIVKGTDEGKFEGAREISRQEIATILNRYTKEMNVKLDKKEVEKFADDEKIADWAKADVLEARAKGIFSGKDNNMFDPMANITRAEVAQVVVNIDR